MTPCAWLSLSFCVGLATMQTAEQSSGGGYKQAPGPHGVAETLYDWHDEERNRDVPVKVYYPEGVGGPFPVVIFSHGLGGSREGYAYLGRHWASHGYVCVHVQHVGSDESVWKGQTQPAEAMRRAVLDPRTAMDRPEDVRFVLDRLERLQREGGALQGRMDLSRMGISGHSFGAFTTMAVAGQAFVGPGGRATTVGDWRRRFKAAIAMSPSPPRRRDALGAVYTQVRIPILHLTGTRDDSPVSETRAADRRVPFDHIKHVDEYLVIFDGGDHMVFSGRRRLRGSGGGRDARFQELIRMSTTAFWDMQLKGDATARRWLVGGGLERELGKDGTFEQKPASRPSP